MTVAEAEPAALFERYLEIVNQALARQPRRSPWAELLRRARDIIGARDIPVAILDSMSARPAGWFAVRPGLEGLRRVDLGSVGPNDQAVWKLTLGHVAAVVGDPEPYLAEPRRLGLDWLWLRLGMPPA